MVRRLGFILFVFLPLALAACSSAGNDSDDTATTNGADPALTSALQQQIMVDPSLSQQAQGDAVRPPRNPPPAAFQRTASPPAVTSRMVI